MVNTTYLSGWKPAEVLHLLGVRYVIARSFARYSGACLLSLTTCIGATSRLMSILYIVQYYMQLCEVHAHEIRLQSIKLLRRCSCAADCK